MTLSGAVSLYNPDLTKGATERGAWIQMAANTRNNDISATNDGPVMRLINKCLSALRKKLNRILAMEETSNSDVFEKSHDELDFEFLDKALKWYDRLAISIGVAKVVHLLHIGVISGCFRNQLKTNNILLDEHHILKPSDYGMSMIAEEIKYLEVKGENPKSWYVY
ncbi:Wall-associated receptor kinase-like 5 [Glycine max]|uniref:wall-associated receptor kinase-like 5 n=1 Tax=Glycine max TaxID=3847 RepID=UPI000E21BEFB|nr:wall-associated receptor kinase-like 5 [Glycine max]KAH1229201.1 Wall-associated receptor kinase-like 5 [Glycine max]|eukprot:XP_025980027.1 wall-associated receptor kinase-like 5 [Glycine max]